MFKTELHCHSKDVSACARVDVETIVKKYTEGGYTSLVLTNHLSTYTYDHVHASDWNDFIDKFVYGYKKLKEYAEGKLNILLGMELRFRNSPNDYLVLGPDEKFLRENPMILDMNVWEFHKLCQEHGYLLIQAHPFRNGMTVNAPWDIDGVSVSAKTEGEYLVLDRDFTVGDEIVYNTAYKTVIEYSDVEDVFTFRYGPYQMVSLECDCTEIIGSKDSGWMANPEIYADGDSYYIDLDGGNRMKLQKYGLITHETFTTFFKRIDG